MDELEIIARAEGDRGYSPSRDPYELDLLEASALSGVSVEGLKRAIRAGELRAERRGWWRIHRWDLNEYLYRL